MTIDQATQDFTRLQRLRSRCYRRCMSPRSHCVLAMMFFVACSSSPAPAKLRNEHRSARAASLIELQPLTISFRGQPIARLLADGRTESVGPSAPGAALIPGPTLRTDGTIVMTKGGVTARIDADGNIYVVNPGADPQLFGRIANDQLTSQASKRSWDVRVRGNMIDFGEANSSQIDGEVTPSMRRVALIMAAAFSIENAITPP